jgi:hypothetical protein
MARSRLIQTRPEPSTPAPAPARSKRRAPMWAIAALTVLVALPLAASGAPRATAALAGDTSQFHGVTWSRLGDNFTANQLVLQGLSSSDDYNAMRSKADAMFAAFQNNLGANTVRLPINPATTSWQPYQGVIDSATAHGFKVILTYWDQTGTNMVPASFLSTFNSMWDTLAARYKSNSLIYYDPINEPVGWATPDWLNFAATWIGRMNGDGVASDHLVIEGAQLDGGGYASDVRPLCNDSRFNNVYLGLHRYAFPYGARDYNTWLNDFTTDVGNCASRTILEEFGTSQDTGVDFNTGTDKEVAFLKAATDFVRSHHMGAIWCHTIGGRTSTPDHDTLDNERLMTAFDGSGNNTPLWIPNTTGIDKLKYAWGGFGTNTTELRNPYYNKCLDVPGSSQNNDVHLEVGACAQGTNQRWTRQANGTITVFNGGKCLAALGSGRTNGTQVVSENCNGAASQQWHFFSDGTVRGVDSKLCLDADLANAQNVQIWSCGNGTNQKWFLAASTIGLRAHANGTIVTAESAGAQPLIANRPVADAWETFDLIDNADGTVSLFAHANNKYVDAPSTTSSLIADATTIGTPEKFDLIFNADNSISLRARVNNDYVTAESAGSQPLIANRTAIGAWEEFDLLY